jgi:DNA topoisomerase-2
MSTETYKRHTHREHILELPDTYIGSTETSTESRWVYDEDSGKISWKSVSFNPGLYKLFDEIIVNARDAFIRASAEDSGRLPVKNIAVTIHQGDDGNQTIISVENDGDGIPIELHETERVYIPELIFGHLLTSSNYNKAEEKIVGGKNGYGAKLTNIFSDRFTVDIKSTVSEKTYKQTWHTNMSVCEKPSVRKATGSKGHVRIEFAPDTSRFKGAFTEEGRMTADMIAIFHTRVVELAAMVGNSVKVSWNGHHIATNTFEKYIKLFLREGMTGLAYEDCGPRWQVGAVLARHLYCDEEEGLPEEKHISFVNGILTRKGGTHVNYVSNHVLKDFCESAKKKKVDVKPGQLKDSVIFFVNATIVNPSFDSQTKECLNTPSGRFGSTPRFGGKLVEGLTKLGLLEEARSVLEARAMRDAKKTDGKKRTTLRGIPKLEDALLAGTDKSPECTLILTEGDSAATSAISGLNVVGREKWGVFPLRGKLLNVKDISIQKFNANEELTAIKRILGLEHGKTYTDVRQLRYGRVMIMADQDHDGSHIKGLVKNLFHTEWPSLLQRGLICTLLTPLLKASKGGQVVPFYSQAEYNNWVATREDRGRGWHVKYYKGLGTSTPAEAREWFRDLHEIHYDWDRDSDEAISLAFHKKRSDDRKKWLAHYDPTKTVQANPEGHVGFSRFVHAELIHFSNADNIRSIPHLMDGLKPSQRKILFSCFKRNLRGEIRVAQLSGYVSEHAAYHHGEASLNSTIIGMSQNFVGSNNINLLKPVGQFGSRLMGGKDAASPRYIHTFLEGIVDTIFRKEDSVLLKYLEDDGLRVEPEFYLPVVPLLVLNGAIGIGTGYSTDIPPYKPSDIVTLLRHRLTGSLETLEGRELDPWWFGFRGRVTRVDDRTWATRGTYELDDTKKTVTITELPVGTWTKDYKMFLDELLTREGGNEFGLKNFDDLYNDVDVKFILYFKDDGFSEIEENPEQFEKNFRLATTWKTTNMCCFVPRQVAEASKRASKSRRVALGGAGAAAPLDVEDDDETTSTNSDYGSISENGFVIKKFKCVGDIIESFVEQRLPAYEARRVRMLEILVKEMRELEAKKAFLEAILSGRLELMRKTDEEIVAGLKTCGIPPLSDPERADEIEGYDYVLRMRIDRVKAKAVDDLEEEVRKKQAEVARLEGETPAGMWLADLAEFERAWDQYALVRADEMQKGCGEVGSGGKKKRVTKKKSAPARNIVVEA